MKHHFALLCYRLAIFILTPILIIALLLRSINHKAYRQRISERLGLLPKHFSANGIVIHAASVGEVLALKPLVQALIAKSPNQTITFTTFTPTGSAQVKQHFGDQVQHCYLPLDNPISSALFLAKLKPQKLILMETELWPNLISQAKNAGISIQLINARLSNKSMKSYSKLTALIIPCLQRFDSILCQSAENRENFIALGANPETTVVSGNLKYDVKSTSQIEEKQKELASFIKTSRPIWLVASTHPGDEEIALNAMAQIIENIPDLLLIIVPRHPERFDEIAKQSSQRFSTARRSEKSDVQANHQVWILDSLGELMAAYSLPDIVTMGGSFSTIGGHNPLEPAFYRKPIIVGPDMKNFNEVMDKMRAYQGVIELTEANFDTQLSEQVQRILNDKELSDTLGEHARTVVDENQGATQLTLEKISQ